MSSDRAACPPGCALHDDDAKEVIREFSHHLQRRLTDTELLALGFGQGYADRRRRGAPVTAPGGIALVVPHCEFRGCEIALVGATQEDARAFYRRRERAPRSPQVRVRAKSERPGPRRGPVQQGSCEVPRVPTGRRWRNERHPAPGHAVALGSRFDFAGCDKKWARAERGSAWK